MKILLIRLMGFGDVASILIPAIKMISQGYKDAIIDVLTFGPGAELLKEMSELNDILEVTAEQWQDDLIPCVSNFIKIGDEIESMDYELIINLDTWFMPCFLARYLKDLGKPVLGNYVNLTTSELLEKLKSQDLTQDYFNKQKNFIASSFPNMKDWWDPDLIKNLKSEDGYPSFYLNHCCGFPGQVDISIEVQPSMEFLKMANGRKIVAVSGAGRRAHKQYKHTEQLINLLVSEDYYVWTNFDGSLSVNETLRRLRVTDLLITVPTSTRWLAKLVGCPVLMIPGSEPPALTAPDLFVEKNLNCQYCLQSTCIEKIDYKCMAIPPQEIMSLTFEFFQSRSAAS